MRGSALKEVSSKGGQQQQQVNRHGQAISVAGTRTGKEKIKEEGIRIKNHQATRQFQLSGSELSGEVGYEVLKVLISKPKGSPDLTPCPANSLSIVLFVSPTGHLHCFSMMLDTEL